MVQTFFPTLLAFRLRTHFYQLHNICILFHYFVKLQNQMYFVVTGQDAKGTSTRKMRAIAVDTLARILRVSFTFASGIFVSKNIEDFLII